MQIFVKNIKNNADTQVRGTENIIKLAQKTGATIFYPQSFLIFDGQRKTHN